MKLLIVFVGLLAFALASNNELLTEEDIKKLVTDDSLTPEQKGLILNSQGKKAIKNIMMQMPCGWPDLGIPPLAPYTNPDLELHLKRSVLDALAELLRFRFDGLDRMDINKLKISYTFSKNVKFDFNFRELRATSRTMNTDTLIDFLQQLGISVRYEGTGPMDFSLHNLRLVGSFKYKMPILWGSIKIYKFQVTVSLGAVRSHLGGIIGNGAINELINDKIEYYIPAFINGNQKEISDTIESILVPRVNAKLKGKKIWSLLGMLGSSSNKCDPTPAPWLAEV